MDEANKKCISNQRLKVEIALPGTQYHYSRFDWTGFIVQITLDDKHTFCTSESFKTRSSLLLIGVVYL